MSGEGLVIVTGGATDEGLSTAEALLRAGRRVSIWDFDSDLLAQANEELSPQGFEPDFRFVDVGDAEDVRRNYELVRDELGVPDALFNMAVLRNTFMLGVISELQPATPTPFWELDLAKMRRVVEVNALGTLFCCAVVAPDMIAAGSGSIVNFSTSPHTQRSSNIPYGASRALVEAFSTSAANQLRPHGVRCNVIASGGRVNRRDQHDPGNEPADWMAKLVVYLASEASRDVSGEVFRGGGLVPAAS